MPEPPGARADQSSPQDIDATGQDESAADPSNDIVVTGSLISNPNLTLSSPVNVTDAQEIALKQSNTAENLLRDIPGVVPSTGSNLNIGNFGQSFVNLRGLGDNRNLVLIDSQRLVPSELRGRFDLNNVPVALIERADVLTGGASTTYGADAISGVVNFILKKRFDGIQLTASEQITERGDGNIFRADLVTGLSFDGGRGSVVVSAGYQKADPVLFADRDIAQIPYNSTNGQFLGSSWATPSSFSLPGLGNQQVRDGALVPFYAGYNANPFNLLQTGFERYNAFGSVQYKLTDAVEFYARGIYSHNTVVVQTSPGGVTGAFVNIPISNPYLTSAMRSQFCAANGISVAACASAAAVYDPANPAYRQVSTVISRRADEWFARVNDDVTEFYDFRAGLRGAITDGIDWDISGAYGRSNTNINASRYFTVSKTQQSLFAVRDASGSIVCRNPADGCVAADFFGPPGSLSEAALNYLDTAFFFDTLSKLTQVQGKISGDIGWSVPTAAAPVSFAVAGEYRKNESAQIPGALAASGDISGSLGAIPSISGKFDVWEVTGELVVPLVEDRPFFEELTAEGGIRYSRYNIDAPGDPRFNTVTWKAGGSWSPVRGLTVRGTFAHAVRAPNISELFGARNTQTIGVLSDDPCANLSVTGSPIPGRPVPTGGLLQACLAQGAPVGQIGLIQQPQTSFVNFTTSGNVNLRPEKSDSYTIGLVLRPEFVSPLSITIDYYNIKISEAVSSPTIADALGACFNAPDGTNPACLTIRRNPLTGTLNGDTTTVPGFLLALSNLGRLETDGVDVAVSYRQDLGFADWSLLASGNWTRNALFQATPTSAVRDCVGVYNTFCTSLQPEFQWSVRNSLAFGRAEASLLWRHIDSMRATASLFSGSIPGLGDVDFNRVPAFDYFDLTLRVNVSEQFTLTGLVQNLFDKDAPIVGSSAGAGVFNAGNTFPSTYDALGRRFVITANVKL